MIDDDTNLQNDNKEKGIILYRKSDGNIQRRYIWRQARIG